MNELPDNLLKEYNESKCTLDELAEKYGVTVNKIRRKIMNELKG